MHPTHPISDSPRRHLGSRAIRLAVGALVAATLVGEPAPAASDARPAVEVRDCLLAIVELHDDAERLQGSVAAPFQVAEFYGPGTGALATWSFSCGSVEVPGGSTGPGQLSLVVIQIDRPDGPAPEISYLHNFDYYVVSARTDRADLAGHAVGTVPVELAKDMSFDRTPSLLLPESHVDVFGSGGDYTVNVAPALQHPYHDHDNSFWSAGADGPHELQLTLVNAIDKWCPYGAPGCSTVTVEEDTPLAAVFGCAVRHDGLGIDHDPVPTGTLTFT